LKLESLEGGRKEIAVFHHDVAPLVLYEIANDGIHILPKDFTTRENTVDRMSDAAQSFGPSLVFASGITDLRSRSGGSLSEPQGSREKLHSHANRDQHGKHRDDPLQWPLFYLGVTFVCKRRA
jgi:hypothetical protein